MRHPGISPFPRPPTHNSLIVFMTSAPNTSSTPSNFEALFESALSKYKRRTGQDLRDHPLAAIFDGCQSPDAILAVFKEQSRAFDIFRNGNAKLTRWLIPIVSGLHTISTSTVISTGASLVRPLPPQVPYSITNLQRLLQAFPAHLIFSGIGVLLSVRVTLLPSDPAGS
jgi:hypothetical protein